MFYLFPNLNLFSSQLFVGQVGNLRRVGNPPVAPIANRKADPVPTKSEPGSPLSPYGSEPILTNGATQ